MILKLKPSTKSYPWGGEKLISDYGKSAHALPLAESWELSCHPDGPSFIDSTASGCEQLPEASSFIDVTAGERGQASDIFAARPDGSSPRPSPQDGLRLSEWLHAHPEALGQIAWAENFPLLIKFIDAREQLSIQVHPDDRDALAMEAEANGKAEAWLILEAEEGSSIYLGFREALRPDEFLIRLRQGRLVDVLRRIPVTAGDFFYIPPGTIHSIGAGIVLAEVQQSSNLTYRVYDFERRDAAGRSRELHLDKALAVLNFTALSPTPMKDSSRPLQFSCPQFSLQVLHLQGRSVLAEKPSRFQSLLVLQGTGSILADDDRELVFRKGDCFFLSAGTANYRLEGEAALLLVEA